MKSKYVLVFTTLVILHFGLIAQEIKPQEKGIIIAVEDGKVYLDLNESNVTSGTRYQVIKESGYFTHPVSGEKIMREPEIIAYIEIIEVKSNYSVGAVSPKGAINSLEKGMEIILLEGVKRETREFRKSIAVQPLNVSSARGGYLGFYIADLLTEELFNIDKFKVVDRQTLGLQMDEIALTSQGVIDEKDAIQIGKTRGVDYFITGTVYEPDVVETNTGVPIKGILSAAEAISGQKLGADYVSDVRVSQLRAIVNLTLRVVDVQTGEILFIATEMQQASGKSQINLEQGALGGLQLQGGATSFSNTITGQATKAALSNLAKYINDYFEGKIQERNFKGNVIEIAKIGTRSERVKEKNGKIINPSFIGNNTDSSQLFSVNINKGKSTGFRQKFSYPVFEIEYEKSRISNEFIYKNKNKIGNILLEYVENDVSQGKIILKNGLVKPENYNFENSEVEFIKYHHIILYSNFLMIMGQKVNLHVIDNRFNFGLKFILPKHISFGAEYFLGGLGIKEDNINSKKLNLSIYISPYFRFNKNFQSDIKIGATFVDTYIYNLRKESGLNFLFEPSLSFFPIDFFSIDINITLSPFIGLRTGLGFHFL